METVTTVPANYVWLALTCNFWGKGPTREAAMAKCREAGGSTALSKYGFVTYRVHPNAYVEGINGDIVSPIGQKPVRVEDKRKQKPK
jgi:hypothetical protein